MICNIETPTPSFMNRKEVEFFFNEEGEFVGAAFQNCATKHFSHDVRIPKYVEDITVFFSRSTVAPNINERSVQDNVQEGSFTVYKGLFEYDLEYIPNGISTLFIPKESAKELFKLSKRLKDRYNDSK